MAGLSETAKRQLAAQSQTRKGDAIERIKVEDNGSLTLFLAGGDRVVESVSLVPVPKIDQRIGELRKVTETASSPGNFDYDPYLHGMANGLILALAILEGRAPVYKEAPEEWLSGTEKPRG